MSNPADACERRTKRRPSRQNYAQRAQGNHPHGDNFFSFPPIHSHPLSLCPQHPDSRHFPAYRDGPACPCRFTAFLICLDSTIRRILLSTELSPTVDNYLLMSFLWTLCAMPLWIMPSHVSLPCAYKCASCRAPFRGYPVE